MQTWDFNYCQICFDRKWINAFWPLRKSSTESVMHQFSQALHDTENETDKSHRFIKLTARNACQGLVLCEREVCVLTFWVVSQMLSGVTQPPGAIRKPKSWPVCVSSLLYPESFWTTLLRGALFEDEFFSELFFQLHTLSSAFIFLLQAFVCISFLAIFFIIQIMTPYSTSLSQMMNECHNALISWHPHCSVEPTRQSKHLD